MSRFAVFPLALVALLLSAGPASAAEPERSTTSQTFNLADAIFDSGMPTVARQDDKAREEYAVSFVCLVADYLEGMMDVTFEDDEEDAEEDPAAAMEIYAALNTRH